MISFKDLRVVGLEEILCQLRMVCKDLEIEFFIVGAIARNIWYASNKKMFLGTKDIDIGVYVPSDEKYNDLIRVLEERFAFTKSSTNRFALISKDGHQLDLLPFGEIEKASQVMIKGKVYSQIDLEGFREVYQFGVEEVDLEGNKFKICTIPGMVILKLIAYDDNPQERVKDVKDISSILLHYPNIEMSLIWDKHADLLQDDLEQKDIGVIALGREMGKQIGDNLQLRARIISILQRIIKNDYRFLSLMIEDPLEETEEMKSQLMLNLLKGFENKIN